MGTIDDTQTRSVAADMERILGAGGATSSARNAMAKPRLPMVVPQPDVRRRGHRGLLIGVGVAAAVAALVPAALKRVPDRTPPAVNAVPASSPTIALPPPTVVPPATTAVARSPKVAPVSPAAGAVTLRPQAERSDGKAFPRVAARSQPEKAAEATAVKKPRRADEVAPPKPASIVSGSKEKPVLKVAPVAAAARAETRVAAPGDDRIDGDQLAPLPQPACRSGQVSDACIYGDVRSADRRLLSAYIDATQAGVPRSELMGIRRDWSRAREISLDKPDEMIRRYEALTRALRRATRARTTP